ncbi:BCCT family transporter [Mycoplasmatota bacterium zrk1]
MKNKNIVYYISLTIMVVIVAWGLLLPSNFESIANRSFTYIVDNFGWFYILSMTSFVLFSIWIMLSKYGRIKLGKDDSVPEYSNISWFAMLFSAGMGIGLVFWGVAEPLNHWISPMVGIESASEQAANFALRKSFLHWGLHPWAGYAVIALSLAYMQFRKGEKGLISSIFIPLIGRHRVNGPIGKLIDIFAIFATVAGVATSLGLGTYQINSGLNYLFGIPENNYVLITIVAITTFLFMLSAITGLNKGIKILSNTNIVLASILMILTFIVGPTILILNAFNDGLGLYLHNLVKDSFQVGAFSKGSEWYGWWTIFYWAWWIAWAPFVGTFIARISKGRTIREFIMGVLLVPVLVSFVWFAIFGTTGINTGSEVASEAVKSTSTAFFVVLNNYPLGSIISLVAIILLGTFFVTSADSGTFVLGMLSSDGNLNPKTSKKVVWGVVQALVALALMLGSVNGLRMLQTMSIVAAFPFAIVMILAMVSIVKALSKEKKT